MKNTKSKKHTFLIPLLSLLSSVMCFSVGFSTWNISSTGGSSVPNNVLVGGSRDIAADYNVVSDGNQSYIDMRFTKQFTKSSITTFAGDHLSNTKNVEYLDAVLTWKNTNSSYNDDVSEYFYFTDNDRPMGDDAPKLYNHETGDTFSWDKQQKIDRTANTFTSSIVYGNSFQNFETSCTPDWDNFEPVYDTNYEKAYADGGSSASSYGGEWMTAKTNFTGDAFPWLRADLRCLVKGEKYYFFILYVFHYTTAHPYSQGRVCRYRGNAFTTYSSQNIESLDDINYVASYKSGSTTYTSGLTNGTTNKYTTKYFRPYFSYKRTSSSSLSYSYFTIYPCTPYGTNGVTYSSNGYVCESTASSINLTNPANYANINNRSIYREVDYSQPIVCNVWPTNVTSTTITWSFSYTYYIRHVEAPQSRTGTISTDADCVFDHFELSYANQYQYTGSAKFYFTKTSTNATVLKTYNENISTRGRIYLYLLINRIKESTVTFDYYIRLRPKNATVKADMESYLKAYKFSFNMSFSSLEIAAYARVS